MLQSIVQLKHVCELFFLCLISSVTIRFQFSPFVRVEIIIVKLQYRCWNFRNSSCSGIFYVERRTFKRSYER